MKRSVCYTLCFIVSGETISKVTHFVLFVVLKLHNILYRKPEPITENSTNPRWKDFKGLSFFLY
ncbi:hypothetical protein LINPERPRIM_LOCUS6015 [Linum perenne]